VIANQVWEMSERVADYDGVRPIIYSRYLLINQWLSPYWSGTMLNEHYYILAQYLYDRTREHPGPPTLPSGVDESRIVMHQTADKKLTPPGEAESATIDWDRWELGNAEEMQQWIAEAWGGETEPPPDPDPDIYEKVSILETQVVTLATAIDVNAVSIETNTTDIGIIQDWIYTHDHPPAQTLTVRAKEQFPLGIAVGHDQACDKKTPPGKPIIEHPPMDERIIISAGQEFDVYAQAAYSCKDDPDTPTIKASGGDFHYIAVNGYPGQVSFAKEDFVEVVND